MFKRSVTEDDLRRLKEERDAADKRYNEALSEVDAALQRLPDFPHPPPAPDETQVTPLNTNYDVLASRPPLPSGWRGRLASFVWGLVEPSLTRQQAFNASLVDHINRNIAPQREVGKSIETTIAVVREQVEQLLRFETRLLVYLQQITPYVDTKDYEFRGLGQRVIEDVDEAHQDTARALRGLAATLDEVSDDMLKRWERYEGLRTSLAMLQHSVHALRRELEKVERSSPAAASAESRAAIPATNPTEVSHALSSSRFDSHKYLSFEDAFRGPAHTISERQRTYLPIFAAKSDVLDIGCGRGEFLALLKAHGVSARGIDLNHAMAMHCRERGLDAHEGDALSYLRALEPGALGGLMAAQVVEHLQPDYLLALLEEAYRVLRTDAPIVLETINVASWYAFFSSYVRDITHARPIHPDTLRFFVVAAGFLDAEVRFLSPLPDAEKLQRAPRAVREVDLRTTGPEGRALLELADAFDRNTERLNLQLYGPHDYAVVAWKR